MMQSLDGYVAGVEGELEPPLHSEWGAIEHEFAAAWRTHPKWVASRTLKSVGTNAALVDNDLEAFVRRLKAKVDGVIAVAGPDLAASLTELGLIDEYHSTFARSFLAAENRTSPVPERRSALLAPRKSARTQSS
jgi:dihydrofolate reductase